MAIYLKQSTASQEVALGYFVDSTDGNTEETGLTIANTDIKLHKAGATTLANKNSGGATHISNGVYYAVLDATDTDTLGNLVIYCHPTGALAVRVECCVLAANVYDSLIGATDLLQVDTTQVGGTTQTAGDIIGDTNDIQARLPAALTAGGNLKADVDTIKTQSVTCAAGVTVLASVGTAATSTAQTGDAFARLGAPAGASVSADVAAIKAKTDLIPAAPASTTNITSAAGITLATGGVGTGDIDSTALNEIADAVLDRVMSAGADSGGNNTTARTVRQALRTLRNKVTNSAGTLTVYKEDDTTTSFTAATATTAGDPISSIDPT